VALSRVLIALRALEQPRQPGDDGDDLAELLDGIDDPPEPASAAAVRHVRPGPASHRPEPSPAPATPPAAPAFNGTPGSGQALYKWACNAQCLPRVNALGKARGWHKLVTHWDADQVRDAYRELTAEPVANGRPH
jgi:hypothetical protein